MKLLLRGRCEDDEVADEDREGPAGRLLSYGDEVEEAEGGDMTVL